MRRLGRILFIFSLASFLGSNVWADDYFFSEQNVSAFSLNAEGQLVSTTIDELSLFKQIETVEALSGDQKISMAKLQWFQHEKSNGQNFRKETAQFYYVPIEQLDPQKKFFSKAPVTSNAQAQLVFQRSPTRQDILTNPTLVPYCRPAGPLEKLNDEIKAMEVAQSTFNLDQALENKTKISAQLSEDLSWYRKAIQNILSSNVLEIPGDKKNDPPIKVKLSTLVNDGLNAIPPSDPSKRKPKVTYREFSNSSIAQAHQITMQKLLAALHNDPKFQAEPERTQNLILYLTLYGEFRQKTIKENHRTLAHLYWAAESMKNRTQIPAKLQSKRKSMLTVDSDFDPTRANTQELNGTLAGAALASDQYEAWAKGTSTLSDILTFYSENIRPGRLESDIKDFIAAYQSNLIGVEKPLLRPLFTHYVSPRAREARGQSKYPGFFAEKSFKTFKDLDLYPNVKRQDMPKQALLNTKDGINESKVELDFFTGGIEDWDYHEEKKK